MSMLVGECYECGKEARYTCDGWCYNDLCDDHISGEEDCPDCHEAQLASQLYDPSQALCEWHAGRDLRRGYQEIGIPDSEIDYCKDCDKRARVAWVRSRTIQQDVEGQLKMEVG